MVLLVREMQGMRNGMTPRQTIQVVVSFEGTPRFIPSFPTENHQVVLTFWFFFEGFR